MPFLKFKGQRRDSIPMAVLRLSCQSKQKKSFFIWRQRWLEGLTVLKIWGMYSTRVPNTFTLNGPSALTNFEKGKCVGVCTVGSCDVYQTYLFPNAKRQHVLKWCSPCENDYTENQLGKAVSRLSEGYTTLLCHLVIRLVHMLMWAGFFSFFFFSFRVVCEQSLTCARKRAWSAEAPLQMV